MQRPGLEDLLAGRVLAWAGGLAVLVGIVLLFAVAVSRGWIGEGVRTMLGALVSFSLVVAGAWLHEQRGRTDAALAALAAGIAGLFAASVVATQLYDLVPLGAGLALALATGALATALAIRWDAQGIAALGIVGGLSAPWLVGAPESGATVAILFVAAACAATVCVARGWGWLTLAAFAVVTPQWLDYLWTDEPTSAAGLACLIAFAALGAASAIGYDVRERAGALSGLGAAMLALNALVPGAAGWFALDDVAGRAAADSWLTGLALAHGGLAAALLLTGARRIGLTVAALAVAIGDVALGSMLDGLPLALAWCATALAFALLLTRPRPEEDRLVARLGLAAHLGLAALHAFYVDAGPDALLLEGGPPADAAPAAAAFTITALAASLLLPRDRQWRDALFGAAIAGAAYLAALVLDGTELALAWAALAVVLAELARLRDDRIALGGSFALLGLAAANALAFDAPPPAVLEGTDQLGAAALALLACAVAGWRAAVAAAVAPELRPLTIAGWTAAALALLLLASIALTDAAGPGALSALWGIAGVGALVAGLLRDIGPLRTGALALLLAALGKAFLYDLAALDPMARVGSFIALGLLLLTGAYAWQRIRPGEPA